MPTETDKIIRLKNPEFDESKASKLGNKKINIIGQTRLGRGVAALLARKNGGGSLIYEYVFEKPKWDMESAEEWIKTHTKSMRSTLSEKPKYFGENVWIPIVRDGTKAYDAHGTEFNLTKEALDKSFASWKGGIVTVNHKFKESGTLSEVKREGEFVYGKFSGMSKEFLAVANSPAYRGVSQESEPVTVSNDNDVTELKGTGVTIVLYPETPACPLNEGCGLPVASLDLNFSLYPDKQINEHSKSTGGTDNYMTEEKISALNKALESTKGEVSALTEDKKTLTSSITAKDTEIADLKTQLAQKPNELKSTVEAALKAQREESEANIKMETAIAGLNSIMSADAAKAYLDTEPLAEAIEIMVSAVKAAVPQAGAGTGDGGGTTSTDRETLWKEGETVFKSMGLNKEDFLKAEVN